nr:MAG TPA: hypothetical protein [Caudoviricetes sp.]
MVYKNDARRHREELPYRTRTFSSRIFQLNR